MRPFLFSMLVVFGSFFAYAADPAQPTMDPKQAEMMKKFQEFSTPGAPHKVLEGMVGEWKYTSKWWDKADAKPQESTGTSSIKMIMGGRWLQHMTKGKAMGMPFEGMGLTGYDNLKGKYETLWIDNMSTGVMHGTGTFNAATKTLQDSGDYSCPLSGDKKREYRGEWKMVDKNNMTYAMFGPGLDDPKEFKQMEMSFKRVK